MSSTSTNAGDIRIADSTTQLTARKTNERLSLPFGYRSPLAISIALTTGFGLGAVQGGKLAGLRFRAENAHRLPTSQAGWFFYHKSKNYNAMLGGLKEGLRMGGRLGVWVAAFVYTEEAIDRIRGAAARRYLDIRDRQRQRRRERDRERYPGRMDIEDLGVERTSDPTVIVQRDFLSTSVAALAVSGAYSTWNRFPQPAFVRVATLGLKVGITYGLVQDALSLARGNKLGYIETIKSGLFGTNDE